jgi:hypothetical protein
MRSSLYLQALMSSRHLKRPEQSRGDQGSISWRRERRGFDAYQAGLKQYAASLLPSVPPSLERGELAWAALNDGLDIAWNAIVRPSEREDSEVNKMVTELSTWIKDTGNPELR